MGWKRIRSTLGACSGAFLSLALVTGCSGRAPQPGVAPATSTSWLAATGFTARASWSSASLHLDNHALPDDADLYSILARVPGLHVRRRPVGGWGVEQVHADSGDSCAVHVFLNGDEVHPNLAARNLLNLNTLVPSRLLDGLELYLGRNGPTLAADGCGSLLLWSDASRTRDDQPFRGSIRGMVRSQLPDSVMRVVLKPPGPSKVPSGVGLFRFDNLLPGPYELDLMGPEEMLWREKVRVYAHQESSVELSIVSSGSRGP